MGLTLLSSLYKPLGILALVAGLLSYRMLLIEQRDAARAKAVALGAQVAELEQANGAMQQVIGQQNAAVTKLSEQAAAAENRAQARQVAASEQGTAAMRAHREEARKIAQAAIPSGCASAIAWGNAQGPELGKW
jgi:hypothetical protein